MTKICCISDTHEQHAKVILPETDILVHTGDFTNLGKIEAVANFAAWMGSQPHAHKICIPGNHDMSFQSSYRNIVINLLRENGITYLEDSGIEVEGLLVWGSPWMPNFYDWAFMLPRGESELAEKRSRIPDETNLLLTHCPPKYILDDTISNGNQGCELLAQRIWQLSSLRANIFGHLHRCGGRTENISNVQFVNAAICTDQYKPTNPPVVIEI